MAIPDFIGTPLFHFACTALENADYREILMCMPDDENVVGWLAQLQVSKGLTHRQIMLKGQSSNYRNYDDVIIELAEEEEDIQKSIISDAAQHAMEYYMKYMEKIPCRTSILTGRAWIQELFDGHVGRREQNLHMPLCVFQALCDTLRSDFGLRVPTRPHGLHIEESVAMFIHTLDGCSNRKLQERFQHSGETVSRHFHAVLEAMKLFTEVHCKPTRDKNSRHPYLRSRGKYVPFKHCIGALDGTHVEAVLPARDAGTYYGRKGYPTQNILAVCDFDMCFIFISCGWEGSMHDSRIFNEITENAHAPFPHPQEGKYYLVDAGYANKKGYLAPYKKSWYHQAQFRDHGRPDNPRELFNEAHASLRSVVERTFGAWKSRWKFLHNMPDYDFATVQVPLVGASMALHNFIRRHEIAANAHNEHIRCCSVPDDMPTAEGGENMDDGLMVGDTDVDMARVRVRIRDHLFHIRNQGLL
ncbi:uncharacterized protein LOC114259144 [Camellia sinensis]|uniref:uncharacterized protein LOC114259144 n=1 Tax=Camellia sinensis TaxID=4442 RepID=UPI001036AF20|nr:uncharacterized protein LOC114259144 [Camellia sinensis]